MRRFLPAILLLLAANLCLAATTELPPEKAHGSLVLRNQSFGGLSAADISTWQDACKKLAALLSTNGPFATTDCFSSRQSSYADGWVIDFAKKGRFIGLTMSFVYSGRARTWKELTFSAWSGALSSLTHDRNLSLLSRFIRDWIPTGWSGKVDGKSQELRLPISSSSALPPPHNIVLFDATYDASKKEWIPKVYAVYEQAPQGNDKAAIYKPKDVIAPVPTDKMLWFQDSSGVGASIDTIEAQLKQESPKLRVKSYANIDLIANAHASIMTLQRGSAYLVQDKLVPVGALTSNRFDLRTPWIIGISAGKNDIAEGRRLNDSVEESFYAKQQWAGIDLGLSLTLPSVVIRLDAMAKTVSSDVAATVGITSLQFGRVGKSLAVKGQKDKGAEVSLETQWSYVRTRFWADIMQKRDIPDPSNEFSLERKSAGGSLMVRVTPARWFINAYLLGFGYGTRLNLTAANPEKMRSENTDAVTSLEVTAVFTGGGIALTW